MSARYSRIPNPQDGRGVSEMEAAFDADDDSDDDGLDNEHPDLQQRRPLVPRDPSSTSAPPGHYDFERVDYDYPPPGSPPRPSSFALPDNPVIGNSNGLLPSGPIERPTPRPRHRSWIARILPWARPSDARRNRVGGGSENDGVFANLTSKPTRPMRLEDADGVHIVPEETQAEAPPSYAAAQADAVPSYWETTIHAPSGGDVAGELIVDSLPTGSLFSFLWSMLVSVAFNFLGFVLTYLLHTTHAAKYGSRAGLGVTLIQYGWALRTRGDGDGDYVDHMLGDDGEITKPTPTHVPSNKVDPTWPHPPGNSTFDDVSSYNAYVLSENSAAWLSFFLMTIGWFLLLSSVLGFWRVKRWERGILHSAPRSEPPQSVTPEHESLSFVFPGFFREGLGLSTTRRADEEEGSGERFVVQEIDRHRQIAEVRINDARLQRNLRDAGLI